MGASFDEIGSFLKTNAFSDKATMPYVICGYLIKAALIFVWGLVAGFVVSMKCTVATAIYCLLRKDVDGTDMTEVYVEEEEEEKPLEPIGTEVKTEAPAGEAVKTEGDAAGAPPK
jgi:hypothetical protein